MFATALVAVLVAMAVPSSLAVVDRSRTMAATRYLAAQMSLARTQAVRRSAHVALRFEEGSSGIAFQVFVDGNRDGVRARDIAAGVDLPLGGAVRLSDRFPGTAIALNEEAGGVDPVRLGATNLLSFTPLGTATSGTVHVRGRDGTQMAVRVLGATGRIRFLRHEPKTGRWTDLSW